MHDDLDTAVGDDCKMRLVERPMIAASVELLRDKGLGTEDIVRFLTRVFYVDLDELAAVMAA